MSENIELRSYSVRNEPDGDIEEYHEIKQDTKPLESSQNVFTSFTPESINEFDFFTKLQKAEPIKSGKKKKTKKKERPANVMDIISSELASLSVPITNNAIEMVEDGKEQRNIYVQSCPRGYRRFQLLNNYRDSENGLSRLSKRKLSPIFPSILEGTSAGPQHNIPVEYVGPVFFSDLVADYGSPDKKQPTKFLDIELMNIKFKHHHEFSLEELLCVKLIENLNEYKELQCTLKKLSRDIKVNRETKDNLKKDLLKVSPNKRDELRFDATVRKYTAKLLQLKEYYFKALKDQKELTHKIISLWSDVEMIREKFECRYTPYNLLITKLNLKNREYQQEWTDVYEKEFTDMLAKIEYGYVTKCVEYKEAKRNQNLDNNSQKKHCKPRLDVDESAVKEKVEELVNSIVNEETIYFTLEKDETSISGLQLKRNNYSFEIYVDKVFVCESESYTSRDKMCNSDFRERFSIEILPNNEILRVVLLENDEKVAHVKIELSKIKKMDVDFTPVEFLYDKDVDPSPETVGSGHNMKEIAAANKVRLKSSNTFKGDLHTKCEVSVKIQWSGNIKETHSDAIRSSMNIGLQLKRFLHGIEKPNVNALAEIIGKIYEKDISNADDILNTLKDLCKMDTKITNDKFPIDDNSAEFIRLKLLHLRNSGVFTNIENKTVPIHGSQISTEQLNCLQKIKEKDFDIDYLKSKEADMDPIEMQRLIAAKYMQKLNQKMLKNLKEHLLVQTQKDVVSEFRDFSWRSLFSRQNNKASQATISNRTKLDMLMESLNKEQEIQVTVQRAFNLLDRSTALLEDAEDEQEMIAEPVSGYKVRPLRPFARASYHGAVAQTVTAIGCHPTWNHTLKLCVKLAPITTLHINIYDVCKVMVSDGSEDQSAPAPGQTVHYRYYNKWLGTAQVPLFTILSLGSLRGTFKITSPPILFGYETLQHKESTSLVPEIVQLMRKDTSYISLNITTSLSHLGQFQAYNQPLPSTVEDDYIIKHLNNFVTNYTNDYPSRNIALTFIDSAGRNKCVTQFLQPIPLPDREYFPRNPKSCGSALSKSSGLSRSSSSKSSGRKREADVEANEERESMWLYSQEGVKGGDSLVKTINVCSRYVALMPTYEMTDTHVVTLMGLELLKVLHGSPLDHTILLSSYFLYLGIKSWVAIGLGLPRGRSTYVLIQYDLSAHRFVLTSDQLFRSRGFLNRNDGYLWFVCDAVRGDRYELRDVGCPMKTVDYVFDNENVWVNTQSSVEVENVSFDFSKSFDWQPVFDKNIFVMKQPIVSDSSLYSSPNSVESLRQSLEVKIKGKVQKWRPHMKTIWNRYCSGLLRDALPCWEYWAFNPNENKPGFSQKFKQLMVTYRIFGFPLNIPFANTNTVISAVKSTALHVNDDPNLEFALGVEVFAYPNNVISVWVFLASITRI